MTGSLKANTLNLQTTFEKDLQEQGQFDDLAFFDALDLSAIETYNTPVSGQWSARGTPPKLNAKSKKRSLNWSLGSPLSPLNFSTASTATNSDVDNLSPRSNTSVVLSNDPDSDAIFVMSLDGLHSDDNVSSIESPMEVEDDNEAVSTAVLVLLTFAEKQIEKLQQEERGPFFFLFYSLPATLDKIDIFRNTVKQIANDLMPLKTLAAVNALTSRLANDSMATSNRNWLSFGASDSKRGLTALSVKDHQAALRKILQAELEKISVLSPSGMGRTAKIGYVDSLFYSQEKTQQKLLAVEQAIYDLDECNWSIDSLDVFLKKLLADNALCQHRSCGFFGKHMGDSTTKQKLSALSQTVGQGVELSKQLFVHAEHKYGLMRK